MKNKFDYQGKRTNQVESANRLAAYSLIGAIVLIFLTAIWYAI